MSKSTAITIIVTAVLIIIGALGWWYFSLKKPPGAGGGGLQNITNLFPFGENIGNNNQETESKNEQGQNQENESSSAPEIREISNAPVSGFLPLLDNLGFAYVRYIDQETGNVYDAPLEIVSKKRISNTTIPKTREVLWFPQGNSFVMRYLDEKDSIQSFYGSLKENVGGEGSVSGKFMPENILGVSLLSTNNASLPKIFYSLIEGANTSFFVAENDGSKPTRVYSSPIKEWLLFGINESLSFIQTKSSGKANSFLFSLNPKTGVANQILSNVVGLSSLPNKNGNMILFSNTAFGYPLLFIYDFAKKTSTPTSLRTFADKCAWSQKDSNRIICAVPNNISSGVYPDDWYQGKVTFSDNIWEIDSSNGNTKEILNLNKNSFFFDVSSFALSEKDKFIVLQEKTNGSLWSIRLER